MPNTGLAQTRGAYEQDLHRELAQARRALKDLWIGTVWGAGKAAAFEANKRAMLAAGIENIGD